MFIMEFELNVFNTKSLTFPLKGRNKGFPIFWSHHWFGFWLLFYCFCMHEVSSQVACGSFDIQGALENTSICLPLPFFNLEMKQRPFQPEITLMCSSAAFQQEDVKLRQWLTPSRNSKESVLSIKLRPSFFSIGKHQKPYFFSIWLLCDNYSPWIRQILWIHYKTK